MQNQNELIIKLGSPMKQKLVDEAQRQGKSECDLAVFFLENRFKLPIFCTKGLSNPPRKRAKKNIIGGGAKVPPAKRKRNENERKGN